MVFVRHNIWKRIRFTSHELDLICRMCAIATATAWGEGDYQDWTEKDSKAFDSLNSKANELFMKMEDKTT